MYSVLIDTREQLKYSFAQKTRVAKLDTGDYSIDGMSHLLCIERKKTVSELAQNVTTERFEKVLERMAGYKYRFLLCEFSWDDVLGFPYTADLPRSVKRKVRVKGKYLQSKLMDITVKYNIPIIYAGDRNKAEKYCDLLLERIWKFENRA